MDFLDISSIGVAYQYVVKIENKFKHQKKWELASTNPQKPKYENDGPNKQPPEKPVEDIGKEGSREDKEGHRKMV